MLEVPNNNTTLCNFEDFILTTYVIIDELYHQFALPEVCQATVCFRCKLSDSEIITISLCGGCLALILKNAWFSFVKKLTSIFFPK